MMMEMMGLHLPGASFVNPNTRLRDALTAEATRRAAAITALGDDYRPIGRLVDERAIVNGVVGLHATGGSTNHLLHLIAIAAAAGIDLRLDDIEALSHAVPLLARVYPNGSADVNHFHAAGGTGFVIRELLDAGLLHDDVNTILGKGLRKHCAEPFLNDDASGVVFKEAPLKSADEKVLRGAAEPFSKDGGMVLVQGNLGRAIMKVSAVKEEHRSVEAPALVFDSQEAFMAAYKAGKLDRDFVAVIRFQGPKANGMPELHKLTTVLGVLQDRGRKVALVTDGRMSGASGKVPAAIHVTPEAVEGGPIGLVQNGDIVRLDAEDGTLEVLVPAAELEARSCVIPDLSENEHGFGRELFAGFRQLAGRADHGATAFAA